nr:hypothetical protein [Tanacetum cinerariifolium]
MCIYKNIDLESRRRRSTQARVPRDPNAWEQLFVSTTDSTTSQNKGGPARSTWPDRVSKIPSCTFSLQ